MELSSSDAVSYTWSPAALVANPNAQTTQVFPIETTTFTIYATDQFGCTGSSEITVYVWQPPYVDAGPDREVDWLEVRLFGTVDADTCGGPGRKPELQRLLDAGSLRDWPAVVCIGIGLT